MKRSFKNRLIPIYFTNKTNDFPINSCATLEVQPEGSETNFFVAIMYFIPCSKVGRISEGMGI